MPITADACQQAAELLAEREDIAAPLAAIQKAKKVRISWTVPIPGAASDESKYYFRDGPEMPMSDHILKLLTADIEEQLAAIDARLAILGVEPPPAVIRTRLGSQ